MSHEFRGGQLVDLSISDVTAQQAGDLLVKTIAAHIDKYDRIVHVWGPIEDMGKWKAGAIIERAVTKVHSILSDTTVVT